MKELLWNRDENIVVKGENAHYEQLLFFLQCCLKVVMCQNMRKVEDMGFHLRSFLLFNWTIW